LALNVDQVARIWGVIPAAGMGRRMGRPKQSLAFRGSTMAGAVVNTVLCAGVSGVVVVTRTELVEKLELPTDPRITMAINDDSESEMIDSIRIGLTTVDEFRPGERDGILVVPADMPTLAVETCRVCVDRFRSAPQRIVVAAYQGKRGHPIIFPYAMREIVRGLTGGLRMLPQTYEDRLTLVTVDDPGADLDIDTSEDYEKL